MSAIIFLISSFFGSKPKALHVAEIEWSDYVTCSSSRIAWVLPHGNLELLGINGTRAICIKEVKSFPATPSCELASRLA